MTTAFPSTTAPEPLQFSITGTIGSWDSITRSLQIWDRTLWVAPRLSVAGLARGAKVTAIGHQDDLSARWIVTHIALA